VPFLLHTISTVPASTQFNTWGLHTIEGTRSQSLSGSSRH